MTHCVLCLGDPVQLCPLEVSPWNDGAPNYCNDQRESQRYNIPRQQRQILAGGIDGDLTKAYFGVRQPRSYAACTAQDRTCMI